MANRKFIYPLGVSPDDPASDDLRRAILRFKLNERTTHGSLSGIFGARVCQSCGQLKEFDDWVSAVWFHHHCQGEQLFACYDCHKAAQEELDPGHIGISGTASGELGGRLCEQPHRFCELCGVRVSRNPDHRFGARSTRWLCQRCIDVIRRETPDEDIVEVARGLSRARYWLRRNRRPRELIELERRIEAARQALEELHDPEKREG